VAEDEWLRIAMGRKLAVRLYWMWRNGCAYSPSFEFGSYVGAARYRTWRAVERRPLDWASRSPKGGPKK